jgi:hypothetical protein
MVEMFDLPSIPRGATVLDTLFIAFSGAGILAALFFRYRNGENEMGKTKSHVGANYWGSYAGTDASNSATIAIPRIVKHRCTSCLTNPQCCHPFR